MIAYPQPSCHNRLKSLNSFSVGLSDGWTSYSTNIHGTCSHHGGVSVWNDEEMKDEANQWCDENPSLCENSHWAGIEGHGNHAANTDDDDDQ